MRSKSLILTLVAILILIILVSWGSSTVAQTPTVTPTSLPTPSPTPNLEDSILDFAQKLGLVTLHQALSTLAPPPEDASSEDFHVFAEGLQKILVEHRHIGQDWHFIEAQPQSLESYFYTTGLLVQCLELAVVTDRAAIENRLLLPPGWDEGQVASNKEQTP